MNGGNAGRYGVVAQSSGSGEHLVGAVQVASLSICLGQRRRRRVELKPVDRQAAAALGGLRMQKARVKLLTATHMMFNPDRQQH